MTKFKKILVKTICLDSVDFPPYIHILKSSVFGVVGQVTGLPCNRSGVQIPLLTNLNNYLDLCIQLTVNSVRFWGCNPVIQVVPNSLNIGSMTWYYTNKSRKDLQTEELHDKNTEW